MTIEPRTTSLLWHLKDTLGQVKNKMHTILRLEWLNAKPRDGTKIIKNHKNQ